jgi:aspartyl protease
MPALTLRSHGGLLRQLVTDADIFVPGTPLQKCSIKAIWDTGATGSCITTNVVRQLRLIPTGKTIMGTAGGNVTTNTYTIDIGLPGNVIIGGIIASEVSALASKCDALIGTFLQVNPAAISHLLKSEGKRDKLSTFIFTRTKFNITLARVSPSLFDANNDIQLHYMGVFSDAPLSVLLCNPWQNKSRFKSCPPLTFLLLKKPAQGVLYGRFGLLFRFIYGRLCTR